MGLTATKMIDQAQISSKKNVNNVNIKINKKSVKKTIKKRKKEKNEKNKRKKNLDSRKKIKNKSNVKNIENKTIRVLHWNCNSVFNRGTDVADLIEIYSPQAICLNEVKCKDWGHLVESLNIQGYQIFHKLRKNLKSNQFAGGVAVLVQDSLLCSQLNLNEKEEEESIGVKIQVTKTTAINVFAYYNAPDKKERRSFLSLELLNKIARNYKNSLIVGDLNGHVPGYMAKKFNANGKVIQEFIDTNH